MAIKRMKRNCVKQFFFYAEKEGLLWENEQMAKGQFINGQINAY